MCREYKTPDLPASLPDWKLEPWEPPMRECWLCEGTGDKPKIMILTSGQRFCPRCKGYGELPQGYEPTWTETDVIEEIGDGDC
jgi:hypothetical protein